MQDSNCAPGIVWQTEPEIALQEARDTHRLSYVFVYRPGCPGCRLMDEGTLRKSPVRQALAHWVCLRLTEHHPFAQARDLFWYPEHLTLDPSGGLLRRHSGYLPADEFIPWLLLAEGDQALRRARYEQATDYFSRVTASYPASGWAPEAVYWLGAASYLATDSAVELHRHWRVLRQRYPDSLWAHKVQADWRMPEVR
ncbi:hypothetical protein [Acidihalobacter ferrooxydans]|uniref:Outer membrane lipoprotein BamD-like domain-containing protein n=1 Tax=Acidihalobacter ferrooxydans TaxID=1765967 RepID=A0A1P8UG11_9GAMM|nr:hypothetical protein [Acidihalobacter ferrooxydans]APZ42793.1 hypothetical protein BW247_06550 [Acidihalobacter ferrooxydans]